MMGTRTMKTRKPRVRQLAAPLRSGPFRLLFSGQAISRTGDIVFQVGLAAYSLRHGKPELLAFALLAQSCGTIAMLLIGGAAADRFGARRMLVSADVARLAAVVGVTILTVAGSVNIAAMAICAALLGTGDGAFEPAFTVAFTELLPAEELMAANSLQSIAIRVSYVAGAGIGGVVVAFGSGATPMAIDALTFAVSLGCVVAARRWPRPVRREPSPLLPDIIEGGRFVSSHRWLLVAIIGFGVSTALVLAPARVLVPLVIQGRLHQGGSGYSILLGLQGVGALIGGIVMGGGREPARPGAFIFALMAIIDLSFAVLAISPWLILSAGISLIEGFGMAAATVVWASLMQRNVPTMMLGRVSSFDWLLTVGAAPLSLAALTKLINTWSAMSILLTVSIISCSISLLVLLLPDLRSIRWLNQAEQQKSEVASG